MEPQEKNPISYKIMLCTTCLLILGIFAILYIYIIRASYNSYENNLDFYIKTINEANISTGNFMKEGKIDTQTVKTNIPNIISQLQKAKDKIEVLKPTDQLNFYKVSLIEGLTNNINIYVQLLNVLNNPEATDIGSSRNNIINFKELCIDCYSRTATSKIKICLQKNTLNFIESSVYYLDQLIKIKKNQSIADSQNTDFIKGINETFRKFQIIKTDFKAYLYSLRNNNSTYDDLISLIIKNKTDLSNLKIDFTKLSVPQKFLNSNPLLVFNQLKNTINDYDLYLDSFTYALANEKVQASYSNFDKNVADKLYLGSDIKMSIVTKEYNDFIEIYDGFKDIR